MIPMMNIIAWSHRAPWPEMRQVEQDLIISRAIVAIFSEPASSQTTSFSRWHGSQQIALSSALSLFRRY
jgi:hypothetical protein